MFRLRSFDDHSASTINRTTGTGHSLPLFGLRDENRGEMTMDKQRMEGGLKKATGTVKEKAGQITRDRDLEAEGKMEKAEGHLRSGIGHAKDAVREIVGENKK